MKKVLLTLSLLATMGISKSIDTKNSQIFWQGTKVTGRHYGTIAIKSGSFEAKNDVLTSGEIIISTNDFAPTDLDGEYKDKLITHLKSDDFLKTEKFPTATLKIKESKGYTVIADLTILGKTQEVSFPAVVTGNQVIGTLIFDRTKFDMKYGSTSFFKSLGDKAIDNEVTLIFNIKSK